MAYGVTLEGFVTKRQALLETEYGAALKARFGQNVNLAAQSVFSNIRGPGTERVALVWELAEAVYNSRNPATAEGVSLDNILALAGLQRLKATMSSSSVYLFGTATTQITAGSIISVQGNPLAKFVTQQPVTLVAGADAVQTLDFDATPDAGTFKVVYNASETAALAFNVSSAALQTALRTLLGKTGLTVSGAMPSYTVTFAGDTGLRPQPLLVVGSNSLAMGMTPVNASTTQVTAGVAQGTVDVLAQATGPTIASAGTLNVIETAITGWSGAENPLDAVVGRNVESDTAARIRRNQTLQVAGAGTVPAIRSRMKAVEGVTDVIVFENKTYLFDVDGRPPKSYEVVVNGGDPQDISDTIWLSKPAGIQTVGNQTGTVIDSEGFSQTVNWSRPTDVPIYLEVDLVTNNEFPSNGATLVEQLLVDFGNTIGIGKKVVVFGTHAISCAFEDVPGIDDFNIRIGKTPGPTLDDLIPIAANEISKFDTSRTQVTVL